MKKILGFLVSLALASVVNASPNLGLLYEGEDIPLKRFEFHPLIQHPTSVSPRVIVLVNNSVVWTSKVMDPNKVDPDYYNRLVHTIAVLSSKCALKAQFAASMVDMFDHRDDIDPNKLAESFNQYKGQLKWSILVDYKRVIRSAYREKGSPEDFGKEEFGYCINTGY